MLVVLSILIIHAIINAWLFAYEEYQEWLGTKEADVKEHIISVAHRFSLISLGYVFAVYGETIQIPFMLGIYWLCTDGFMNLMKKRKFFAVSNESGNPFEKWNVVKFSLIIIGIILIVKGI